MRKILSLLIALLVLMTFTLAGCNNKEDISLGNIVIFGDSYSTFTGYIPDGYHSWYSPTAGYTDVNDAKETWWHQLVDRTYSNLLMNSSYSGSTICHTGYDGKDVSDTSFVARMTQLFAQTDFKKEDVDTVFVYGGLNDCWANAPLGQLMYEGFEMEDLYSVYPAFCYLLVNLKSNLPNARIIVIVEEYLTQQIKDAFITACQHLQIEYIAPQNISKVASHPDLDGMDQLTDQIIEYLNVN